MNMKTIFQFCAVLILTINGITAQGTLQFNRVLLLNDQSGAQTVPAGKVWKVAFVNTSAGRRVTGWLSWGSETWTATKPNPCTGATSGTSSGLFYVNYGACPTGGNSFTVNGQSIAFGSGNPLWLPAGAVVNITGTQCINTANITHGAQPYYNNSDGVWQCGPFNVAVTPVSNSPVASIIEFNILP